MTNNIQKQDLNMVFYYCPILGLRYEVEEKESLFIIDLEMIPKNDLDIDNFIEEWKQYQIYQLNSILEKSGIQIINLGSEIKQIYGR